MRGSNPIRAAEKSDGTQLFVKEIFFTLQGEGPRAGEPAVFIRLGGCNLACDFCDTEFEDFLPMSLEEIINQVNNLRRSAKLIVITGGEPFRQNIMLLCESLLAQTFNVQIETNGTLWREIPRAVEIVCSPKNTGLGYAQLRPDLASRITALKFILSKTNALYRDIPAWAQSFGKPVFLQPMDELDTHRNQENMEYVAQICMSHGFNFSLQLHKILGLP